MKICDIPYETANQRHPEAVALILKAAGQKLKRSRAKNKGKDLSELLWSYHCTVRGRCLSLSDLVNHPTVLGEGKTTLEARVAQRLEATTTYLVAEMPGAYGSQGVPNPPEITTWAREEFLRWDRG